MMNATVKTILWAGLAWLAIKKLPELTDKEIDTAKNDAANADKTASEYYRKLVDYLKSQENAKDANDKGDNRIIIIKSCPADVKKTERRRKIFY